MTQQNGSAECASRRRTRGPDGRLPGARRVQPDVL